jgi:SAM-dependent methyltransferase
MKILAQLISLIIDRIYIFSDKFLLRRTRNLRLIPTIYRRKGGKKSYAEWAHVIGIFQTLFYQNLKDKNNVVFDIGCGTGLLGIAAEPHVNDGGRYIGIDVSTRDIGFCRRHFKQPNFEFIHFDVHNATYAGGQQQENLAWPVEDNSMDLATALSVWTHLNETDACFYFKEIYRVLKPGGKAIVTFFYLDEKYEDSLKVRNEGKGRYHSTLQKRWIYDQNAYKSDHWFTTKWVKHPEDAIGVDKEGMQELLNKSGLKLINYYPGNWKEKPGLYFQDVLVFEK